MQKLIKTNNGWSLYLNGNEPDNYGYYQISLISEFEYKNGEIEKREMIRLFFTREELKDFSTTIDKLIK